MRNDLYNKLIAHWGPEIHFEDGMILEPKNTFKSLITKTPPKDYFYSAKLSNKWNYIEKLIGEEDHEETLMVEAMYQVFNEKARDLFEKGTFSFAPLTIPFLEIGLVYEKLLKDEHPE